MPWAESTKTYELRIDAHSSMDLLGCFFDAYSKNFNLIILIHCFSIRVAGCY